MYQDEMAVAIGAVMHASKLCRRVRAALVTDDTMTKKDRSPVTVADLGAQAIVSHALMQRFPSDPLVAEETAAILRDPENVEVRSKVLDHVAAVYPDLTGDAVLQAIDRGDSSGGSRGRFWTVDPIDGTKGFIRGDQYAIAVALIEDGEVVVGVLGCPNLPARALAGQEDAGVIYAASKAGGCVVMKRDGSDLGGISVADVADPGGVRVCQSVEAAHTSHSRAGRIVERLGIKCEPVCLDSQCKYAVVARGEAGIYMRLPGLKSTYTEKIWDHAAGWMIVTEAGGRVSDIDGRPLDFSRGRELQGNRGVVATSAGIHEAVLEAVQAVYAEDAAAEAAGTPS